MEKENQENNIDLPEIEPEDITIVENLDLNALFNLSYNFDLLKGIITTILKNQETFKKQIQSERKKNDENSRSIEALKSNILSIKENYISNEVFTPQIQDIKSKISHIEQKISLYEEDFEKSKI